MNITLWQSNHHVGKSNIDQSDSTSHIDSIVGAACLKTSY
jgi:hypothetical protein